MLVSWLVFPKVRGRRGLHALKWPYCIDFLRVFKKGAVVEPAASAPKLQIKTLATIVKVACFFILPVVSELRKRFEGITTSASDWEMNR